MLNDFNNFTDITSGTVYLSFLLRVDNLSASTTEGSNICLDAAGGSTNLVNIVNIKKISSSTFNIGIKKIYGAALAYSPVVLNTNTTYLIVSSYTFINGASNDICKLYINTSGVPANEPAVPSASTVSGIDATSIGQIALNNSYFDTGLEESQVKIDGIRIGTTWANTLFQNINVQLNLKASHTGVL